jgi:uroporphyrinogen III methyltransferase/synthase
MAEAATVYLVGAGPGDPGLLTMRAHELLERCDCIVYDYLVNPELLAIAPAYAERHFVGKRGGKESITQNDINALLIQLARRCLRIVRLKGGDPFLFGRGGEEALSLAQAGINFEIVPGVTSGIAVPAYAGIPVTHRAASSAVAFCTGHEHTDKNAPLDWSALAKIETLVLYMGMHRLADICKGLIEHGKSAETPACVIQWGTYAHQRTVAGTLTTLPKLAADAGIGAPAIAVVGEVVKFRDKIRWFDNRPLCGKTVVVTRSREQASELSRLLTQQGARVIEFPVNHHEPPLNWDEVDAELKRLDDYNWIIFASAHAVHSLWGRMRSRGLDARAFAAVKIAAVGPATAKTLESYGMHADLVPLTFSGDELAKDLIATHAKTSSKPIRALLPQADNANPKLQSRLTDAGATAKSVTVYRNLPVRPLIDLSQETVHAFTFASSATVERFVATVGKETLAKMLAAGARCYAIGPETAAAMRALKIPCAAVADQATISALVEQVVKDLGKK